MNIENSPIQFHPSCQFEKLQLTTLQLQYLDFLRANKSIYDLVQHYMAFGWLVSFKELYLLIETLATYHWILNPEIKEYFASIKRFAASKGQPILQSQSTPVLQKDLSHLLQLPFFRSIDKNFAEVLLRSGRKVTAQSNMYVCRTGDSTRDLYVLISGQIGIYKGSAEAKHLTAMLGPSSVFGEAAFLLNKKRSADLITLKESEIFIVPYNAEILTPYLNTEKASLLQRRFWVQHALVNSDFFKNLPADCFDALTHSGKIIEPKNHILFREGDLAQTAYIIIQGALTVQQAGKNIAILNQGALCGEIGLMAAKGLRTATVLCQKNTLLLEIHQSEFYRLLSLNLSLAKEIETIVLQHFKNDAARKI